MEKQNLKKAHETSILIQWLWCLLFIVSSFSSLLPVSATEDRITTTNSINKNQTIISAGGKFALGFFSPHNSTSSYLGIWYNTIPKLTIIWVANRASPIPKSSPAVFQLSGDGNLVVLSGTNEVVWTSNVTLNSLNITSSTVAVLLDDGNLQLKSGEGGCLWQSFDHPSDTYVAEMKISSNRRTGQELHLTSWINDEDPSLGIFSIGIDPNGHQFYIWKGHQPYWRSNVYATTFSYASPFVNYDRGFSAYISWVVEEDEIYLVSSISTSSISTRFTLVPSGRIELLVWVKTRWMVLWQAPLGKCDFYSHCGPFTICQKNESIPLCKCLTGFQPKSHNEWIVGNWTGGCVRNKTLRCDKGDRFLKFEKMKLPDHAVIVGNGSVSDCEHKCFQNCSCTAYAYANVTDLTIVVCLNWFRELVDIVNNYDTVDESQEHSSTHTRKRLIAVAVAIVSIGLLLISIFGYFRSRKRQERINSELLGFDSMSTTSGDGHSNAELISFSLRSVLAATDSFSVRNKLGEGGFGPVYKAWDNWMEGRALDLIDPSVRDTYNPLQAVKCINVGLLCVQEIMSERPTMSEVVVMLSNETATIQSPKNPAFIIHRSYQMSSRCSNNEITMTDVEPR
ncbi:Apple-like protein [Cynara cardunculus var. scolymus]|uniref:Apple-like protein n=1 Tax=Cynara cardunculus var. scolymus TaxID=59895 RepID=A0A103MM20_CYNCS|nr:Apple-like protein [Cynara cardunculus var. scolymus]